MEKARKLSVLAGELQDKIIATIIEMMSEHKTKLISFVNNGLYSDFDVDRAFAYVDEGVVTEEEVIAVHTDGKSVHLLCDDDRVSSETLNKLEEFIIFTDDKEVKKIYDNADFITIDATFAPTDTLLQLVYSVEEALECVSTQGEG